jgi:ATP-dependent Lon protease
MNLIDDVGAIVGHSSSWQSARAGLIATALLEGDTAAPVIFVDEVDKAPRTFRGDDSLTIFHSLLEPENAREFVDAYLNVPLRADHIIWIMTANDLSHVAASIVDRMLVIPVPEMSKPERISVIGSIYRATAVELGFPHDAEIAAGAANELLTASPRQTKRIIRLAFGFAAEQGRRDIDASDVRAAKSLAPQHAEPSRFGFLARSR